METSKMKNSFFGYVIARYINIIHFYKIYFIKYYIQYNPLYTRYAQR